MRAARTFLLTLSLVSTIAHASPGLSTKSDGTIEFPPQELRRCEGVQKRAASDELNRIYDLAFPAYIEFCAGSTWHKRGETDGGNFGHAFGLIHGACLARDISGAFVSPQQFVPCAGGTVSFSSESVMFNQQWVGGEGRDFMLYGNHDAGKPFDQQAWESVRDEAWNRGMFNGFQMRPSKEKEIQELSAKAGGDPAKFRRDWIATYTFGTEFAVAATRGGVACARIPLSSTKSGSKPLATVLDYLNMLNRKAAENTRVTPPGASEPLGYDYDGIVNNCVHTVYNALAALDMWPWKNNDGHPSTKTEVLFRAGDAVAPFNQLLDAYLLGKEMKQPQVDHMLSRFRGNRAEFERFKQNGWYATQVGTMIDDVPPLAYMNHIYDPTNQTNFISISSVLKRQLWNLVALVMANWMDLGKTNFEVAQPLKDEFDGYVADTQGPAMNLVANLESWQRDYGNALIYLRAKPTQERDEVYREVLAYLERKLAETSRLLKRTQDLTPKTIAAECRDQ